MLRASRSLQQRIVPGLRYHQDVWSEVLDAHVAPTTRWLDLGCGRRLLPEWQADTERNVFARASLVAGIDYDMPSLRAHETLRCRARGDVSALPFGDAAFDLVTANMVVEHLADPVSQFREVARVLRPGGTFLFHTPNAAGYQTALVRALPDAVKVLMARVLEGRDAGDVFPTHYRANTAGDIRRVAGDAAFLVARLDFVATFPALVAVPPLAAVELLYIRDMERSGRHHARPNLICALTRLP